MKNYNNFVNDELNEGKFTKLIITVILSIIAFILIYPTVYLIIFYKKHITKDVKLFLNSIEKGMDILYTYTKYIKDIDITKLNSDELKKLNKIKKILIKKFKTIEPSEEQIKKFFIKKSKIKKLDDLEIIKNYKIREYSLSDTKLINFILSINNKLKTEYNELDPFNEDEWDEDEIYDEMEPYLNKKYYVAYLDPLLNTYFGKFVFINNNGRYGFGRTLLNNINKDEFLFYLNKFNTTYNINKINLIKYKYIIVSEDNRELFKQSISHNFNYIKKYVFRIKKDSDLYYKLTPDSLMYIMDNYGYSITYLNVSELYYRLKR